MLNFVLALCAVKYQGPLQYTLSALAKNSTFSVHNGEKSDMKNALYVRMGHFTAVSEGFTGTYNEAQRSAKPFETQSNRLQ